MKCPDCGAQVLKDLAVCPACGKDVRNRTRTVRCRHCGAKVPVGVRLCPQCGRAPTLRGRVRLLAIAILLGFLIGTGATIAGQDYLSEVRYRLGVMLLEGAGVDGNGIAPPATPASTPAP